MGNADRLTKTTKEKIMSNLTNNKNGLKTYYLPNNPHKASCFSVSKWTLEGPKQQFRLQSLTHPRNLITANRNKRKLKQEASERIKFCKLFQLYVFLSVSPKNSNPHKNNCLQMLDVSLLLFLYYYRTCWWWNVLFVFDTVKQWMLLCFHM